jgi:hypothetical protein
MLCFSVKLMVIFSYRNTFSLPLFSNTVRNISLRMLTIYEKNILHLTLEDKETRYRAKIILLKDEGYTVPEIRKITNHHDNNIRKWIHSIDSMKKGLMALCLKKHSHKQYKFDNDMEKKIVDITSSNPRSYGLGFST